MGHPSRRTTLLGAASAALPALGGGTVSAVPGLDRQLFGPGERIEPIRRTLAALAAGYDTLPPSKVASAGLAAAAAAVEVVDETAGSRDAHRIAAEAWLMAAAGVAEHSGDHVSSERACRSVVSHALLAGDQELVADGWVGVAIAARQTGAPHAAIQASRRALEYAGSTPARVKALVQEARSAASIPRGVDAHTVLDAVLAAEEAHAALPDSLWGPVGYNRGTYHPANLYAFGGDALVGVGLYGEATARLAEAAEILDGTGGLEEAYVWLLQSRVAVAVGDLDAAAEFATAAVERARPRPAAWVARIVGELDRAAGGAFAELAAQTAQWGFPSHA